jgi:hypothetical protein
METRVVTKGWSREFYDPIPADGTAGAALQNCCRIITEYDSPARRRWESRADAFTGGSGDSLYKNAGFLVVFVFRFPLRSG